MNEEEKVRLELTRAEAERVLEAVDPTKGRHAVTPEEHKLDLRVIQRLRALLDESVSDG